MNYIKKDTATKDTTGFTLIELLLVVSLIVILVGVTVRVLNREGIQRKAINAVRKETLGKVAESIEVHNAAEGSFPAEAELGSSPYLEAWPPVGPEGASYTYSTDGVSFQLCVTKAATGEYCYSSATSTITET